MGDLVGISVRSVGLGVPSPPPDTDTVMIMAWTSQWVPTSHAKTTLPTSAAVKVYEAPAASAVDPTSMAPVSSQLPVGWIKTLWVPVQEKVMV
jgi:hypothetical protein